MRSVAIELVQMVEDAGFQGSGEHEWQRRDQFERFLVGFLRHCLVIPKQHLKDGEGLEIPAPSCFLGWNLRYSFSFRQRVQEMGIFACFTAEKS